MNKKLLKYAKKCETLSEVETYVNDNEVAEAIKNVPTGKEGEERFKNYKFKTTQNLK